MSVTAASKSSSATILRAAFSDAIGLGTLDEFLASLSAAELRALHYDFELWARQYFVVTDKADSQIAGAKGNLERFYKLLKV